MLIIGIGWLFLATLSGLALGRVMRFVDAQDRAESWASFCAAHGLDEITVGLDSAPA